MKWIKNTLIFSLKSIPRSFLIAGEIFVVFSILMALALGVFLGRLSQSPVDLTFAKTVIAEALSSAGRDITVDFDRAVLSWPDVHGPFHLRLDGLRLNENTIETARIRDVELLVAPGPLLLGQIRPVRLILDSPVVGLTRDLDHRLHLSVLGTKKNKEILKPNGIQKSNSLISTSENAAELLLARLFGDSTKDYGMLSKVREIEVRNARLRIVDHVLGITWGVQRTNLLFQEVDVGVMGTINIELTNKQQFSISMTYNRSKDEFLISSGVKDFPLLALAGRIVGMDMLRRQHIPLSGDLTLQGKLNPFQIDIFNLKANAPAGMADIGDSAVHVLLPLSDVHLDLSYDRVRTGWNVSTFNFKAADTPVTAGAILSRDNTGAYQGAVQLKIKELLQEKLVTFWPQSSRDHGPGKWLTQKLSGATFRDVQIDLPVWAGWRDDRFTIAMLPPRAQWAFDYLRADYQAPLTPITNGRGTGTFENDTITVNVASGNVSDLTIPRGTVVLTDVSKAGAGEAKIDMTLAGPVRTILNYIKDDPIALGDKIPAPIDTIQGVGTYHALVSFPTLKDLPKEMVHADVDAVLDHIVLPNIVGGQTISGGPYTLIAQKGVISLTGAGQVGGRPANIDWTEPIVAKPGSPCALGKIFVDTDSALRAAFMGNGSYFEGSFPVNLEYQNCHKGVEIIAIKGDLTPTRIKIKEIGYEKSPGKVGHISLNLRRQKNGEMSANQIQLKASGLYIKDGTLTFNIRGSKDLITLTKAVLPDYKWGNSSGVIIYNRYKDRIAIDIAGPSFDLGPLLSSKSDSKESPPLLAKIKVDRLGFGGTSVLENAMLHVDISKNSDLERMDITGHAGGGDVSMKYIPDATGRMSLNVNAGDAGAFLRALNVYDNVQGGVLSLNATPIGNNNRDVKGVLVLRDFAVVKAPVLAQLLGALSIKGLADQLGNQGINFDRLESGFALLRRPGQDVMSFREGRTSGAAIGITFDGLYDRRKSTVDITGTIIPVAGLNTFTSKIPLIGRLLAGGEGSALFAATYFVKGPTENPKTMINPLAVLTPGILRKIFFEDRPDDPLKSDRRPPRANGKMNE